MREIDIIIDGRRADTYRDESVTLDFNSSILGDISSIKCSASKTIRLPKTLNNDAIFNLAHMPSRDSDKARKVLSCEMYVDGVAVFSRGLCHLLSSDGDHYEVAMTFGIMHQGFEQWLKDKPKLRDLQDSDSDVVAWDSAAGVSLWYGGISQYNENMPSMWYARYNCGVKNDVIANIHPCVTLREVYARIAGQNALPMSMPYGVLDDMSSRAIVLKNNNRSTYTRTPVNTGFPTSVAEVKYTYKDDEVKKIYFNFAKNGLEDFFDVTSSSFLHSGAGDISINIREISLTFQNVNVSARNDLMEAVEANPDHFALVIEGVDGTRLRLSPAITNTPLLKLTYIVNRTFSFSGYTEEYNGNPLLKVYAEIRQWSDVPDASWRYPNEPYPMALVGSWWYKNSLRDSFSASVEVSITLQESNDGYPMDRFTLAENLPDITQIDFINFICKYYGMFPGQDGDSVAFVPFSRLFDNIDANSIYDWSEKLTESYLYYPNNVGLTIDGYAQRNVITYKEDKKDPVDVSASLLVEDESLEQDKKLIEFPFAASRGSLIPQYSLNDEGELEKNDVEYRIMRITYGENYENNALNFTDDMKCQQILNRHYSELQDAIRKPMQIEEDIMLSLLDLQAIDYSKPVYLSKYGRYFAVISIQWQSDQQTSKVKLLRIK